MNPFDEIPIVGSLDDHPERLEAQLVSAFDPGDQRSLDRNRPYSGQSWTSAGVRGQHVVSGLTMRDVKDCYVLALYECSGLPESEWPRTVYELPDDDMDLLAVSQCMVVNIEKMMGIYPNTPKLEFPGE